MAAISMVISDALVDSSDRRLYLRIGGNASEEVIAAGLDDSLKALRDPAHINRPTWPMVVLVYFGRESGGNIERIAKVAEIQFRLEYLDVDDLESLSAFGCGL